MDASEHPRWLLFLGMLLFFVGLATGFGVPAFTNPRMALSAHLEGVMNGMFFILIGAVWGRLKLAARGRAWAFWLLLYGGFANWIACALAAIWGTAAMTPIASGEFRAASWQEGIVGFLFASVGVTMAAAALVLLYGFLPRKGEGEAVA